MPKIGAEVVVTMTVGMMAATTAVTMGAIGTGETGVEVALLLIGHHPETTAVGQRRRNAQRHAAGVATEGLRE